MEHPNKLIDSFTGTLELFHTTGNWHVKEVRTSSLPPSLPPSLPVLLIDSFTGTLKLFHTTGNWHVKEVRTSSPPSLPPSLPFSPSRFVYLQIFTLLPSLPPSLPP